MAMVIGGVLWIVNGQNSLQRGIDKAFNDLKSEIAAKNYVTDNRVNYIEAGQKEIFKILKANKMLAP